MRLFHMKILSSCLDSTSYWTRAVSLFLDVRLERCDAVADDGWCCRCVRKELHTYWSATQVVTGSPCSVCGRFTALARSGRGTTKQMC